MGMPSGMYGHSSTSTSRLVQSSTMQQNQQQHLTGNNPNNAASSSLKIASKGSKQMNQFRYGPVRAVQQPMPHSYVSGMANLKQNVLSQQNQQRRQGQGNSAASGSKNLVPNQSQKQRPSSSKPNLQNSAGNGNLDISGISTNQERPMSSSGVRPASPGSQNNQNIKKQRIRSSSPAVQNGPASTKAKQAANSKGASGTVGANNSFNQGQKVIAAASKVNSNLNNKLVPQLYMRGYSPSKPNWKF